MRESGIGEFNRKNGLLRILFENYIGDGEHDCHSIHKGSVPKPFVAFYHLRKLLFLSLILMVIALIILGMEKFGYRNRFGLFVTQSRRRRRRNVRQIEVIRRSDSLGRKVRKSFKLTETVSQKTRDWKVASPWKLVFRNWICLPLSASFRHFLYLHRLVPKPDNLFLSLVFQDIMITWCYRLMLLRWNEGMEEIERTKTGGDRNVE